MLGRVLLTTTLVAGLAGPALASQCPTDIGRINAALARNPGLPPPQVTPVTTLRDMGERLHNAGKHDDAVRALGQAKAMLEKMGIGVD